MKAQAGFTLIEILLYVTLTGLMILGLSGFMQLLSQIRAKNETISVVSIEGNQVMQAITQTIRNGTHVTVPATGSAGTTLTVTTASASTNPTSFSIAGGLLQMTEGASPAVPLSSNRVTISNLSFQNLSRAGTPATIRISFTVTYVHTTGRQEYTYAKNFYGTASDRY